LRELRGGTHQRLRDIAISVICADSESRANRCDAELVAQGCYQSNVVGTPKHCAETLKLFGDLFGVDEIIIATFIRNHRERRAIYRQLAAALQVSSA
jgi:alkanesulfonate monooxygenase SsuD/methylene tetrahydromethanopterin reductase-like flavin-dependent oxidoreductase (luciferase family)